MCVVSGNTVRTGAVNFFSESPHCGNTSINCYAFLILWRLKILPSSYTFTSTPTPTKSYHMSRFSAPKNEAPAYK